MPHQTASQDERDPSVSKRIIRKLAPWYGGAITLYSTLHAIYGWLHGIGALQVSLPDLIFNICIIAGITAICAAIFGGMIAFMGYPIFNLLGEVFASDAKKFGARATWIASIAGALVLAGFLLFAMVTDPRDFNTAPKYDTSSWIFAAIGAVVLIATYALWGKKIVHQLKDAKTELDQHS
ncbi:MAG TPA: hypothetical protein VN828_00600 [Acidobacteriaceae bacterium]|nr:hypothetical protein [Acidobacteriaceae bacterium]